MSDWFNSSSSQIPDEMWRAPTPLQRQADAVVLWAELTGKHASSCGSHGPSKTKKRLMKKKASLEKVAASNTVRRPHPQLERLIHTIADHPGKAGAIIGAPIGAGKAYLDHRPSKGGISKAEAKLLGDIVAAEASGESTRSVNKLKKRLESAKARRENLLRTTATGAAIGGVSGAGLAHLVSRQAGPK